MTASSSSRRDLGGAVHETSQFLNFFRVQLFHDLGGCFFADGPEKNGRLLFTRQIFGHCGLLCGILEPLLHDHRRGIGILSCHVDDLRPVLRHGQ